MEFAIEFDREPVGDVLIVTCLESRFDHRISERFKQQTCAVANGRTEKVVVDLEKVDFMDSSALAALICVLKRLGASGELVICGIGHSIRTFLQLTRMDRVFYTFPDVRAAVASLHA